MITIYGRDILQMWRTAPYISQHLRAVLALTVFQKIVRTIFLRNF